MLSALIVNRRQMAGCVSDGYTILLNAIKFSSISHSYTTIFVDLTTTKSFRF